LVLELDDHHGFVDVALKLRAGLGMAHLLSNISATF